MTDLSASQTLTSTDTREGLLLRIDKDETGNYTVSDVVGLRFGYGLSVQSALMGWWGQVSDILALAEAGLGDPLLSEARSYRLALGKRVT